MAFDSNPQAVYHGVGNPTMELIGSTSFTFSANNEFTVADSGEALNRSELSGKGLLFVVISQGTNPPSPAQTILEAQLPTSEGTIGSAGDNDTAIGLRHRGVLYGMGFGGSDNVIAFRGSGSVTAMTFTFYEMT